MRTKKQRRKGTTLGGNTKVGRALKRLMGDRVGGVLMEYVVLGLLVVAAVAVAVIAFSGGIKGALETMGLVTVGETEAAAEHLGNVREQFREDAEKGEEHHKTIAQ